MLGIVAVLSSPTVVSISPISPTKHIGTFYLLALNIRTGHLVIFFYGSKQVSSKYIIYKFGGSQIFLSTQSLLVTHK